MGRSCKPVQVARVDGILTKAIRLVPGLFFVRPLCTFAWPFALAFASALALASASATGWLASGSPVYASQQTIRWLIAHGFEVGDHTLHHLFLGHVGPQTEHDEIGGLAALVQEEVPGYQVQTLAYPFGSRPRQLTPDLWDGQYQGQSYHIAGALLVGSARPITIQRTVPSLPCAPHPGRRSQAGLGGGTAVDLGCLGVTPALSPPALVRKRRLV